MAEEEPGSLTDNELKRFQELASVKDVRLSGESIAKLVSVLYVSSGVHFRMMSALAALVRDDKAKATEMLESSVDRALQIDEEIDALIRSIIEAQQ